MLVFKKQFRVFSFYSDFASITQIISVTPFTIHSVLFTMWWCYTGWVKRVILTFLSYYITFLVLLHPFGIIFTLFPILLHPFGIIFTLLVILLHLFGVISTLLADSPPLLYCWQQQTQNDSRLNPKHSTLSLQSASLIWNWTPCQNISLCLKFCILECTDELSCDINFLFSHLILAFIVYVLCRGYIGYLH